MREQKLRARNQKCGNKTKRKKCHENRTKKGKMELEMILCEMRK